MPLILNLMCLGALASACTTVLVNTTSGVSVIGRTMELGSMDLPTDVTNTKMWRMMTVPRGNLMPVPYGPDGLHLSIYGFAGIGFWAPETAETPPEVEGVMGEGMNEKGLTVSALSFNSQGAYEAPGSGKPALACVDVVPYLLGSAKTAAEAVALLRGVAVVDDAHLTPLVGRFHWAVQDAAGAMVVLEYVGGALHVQCPSTAASTSARSSSMPRRRPPSSRDPRSHNTPPPRARVKRERESRLLNPPPGSTDPERTLRHRVPG